MEPDRLDQRLRRLAEELRPNVVPEIHTVELRMRRRQRRTRLLAGLATVAVLGATGAVAAVALGGGGNQRQLNKVAPLTDSPSPADPSVYPSPRSQNAGGLGACPGLTGLTGDPGQQSDAVQAALNYLAASTIPQAEQYADQSMWQEIQASTPLQPATLSTTAVLASPLSGALLRTVHTFCGELTVTSSWQVAVCGTGEAFATCQSSNPDLIRSLLVLDRHGHYLVWLIGSY